MKLYSIILFQFLLFLLNMKHLTGQISGTDSFKVVVQQHHTSKVLCVDFSSDGKYFVSGGLDNTVRIWDTKSCIMVHAFNDHQEGLISDVAISPDNKYIVSISDKMLTVWRIENLSKIWSKNIKAFMPSVCFSSTGKKIFCLIGREIFEFDINNSIPKNKFNLGDGMYLSCSLTADNRYLYAGGIGAMQIWDVDKKKLIRKENCTEYTSLSIKNNLRGSDGIIIKSAFLQESLKKAGYQEYAINNFDVSHDRRHIVAFCEDKGYSQSRTIFVFDSLYNIIYTFDKLPKNDHFVKFIPGKSDYVVLHSDKIVTYKNAKTGQTVLEKNVLAKKCLSLDKLGEKPSIAVSINNTLVIWDIKKFKPIKTKDFIDDYYEVILDKLEFIQDSNVLVVDRKYVKNNDRLSYYYSIDNLDKRGLGNFYRYYSGNYSETRFSPDKECKVDFKYGSLDGKHHLYIYNYRNQKHTDYYNRIGTFDFSFDSKLLVAAGMQYNQLDKGFLIIWDLETMKPICDYDDLKDGYIMRVKFTKDGKNLLTYDSNQNLSLRDLKGRVLKSYKVNYFINEMKVFNDVEQIVLACYDGALRFFDMSTGAWVGLMSLPDLSKWICFTHDGYWDASTKGGDLLAMAKGLDCWNIDQFAVRNNRPDIILQRLGSTDKELIDHYYQQYKKRLRKLGLTEEQLSSELHVPSATITDNKQEGKFVTLNFKISDDKYNLKQYNIYLNDVPIFGVYGKQTNGQSQTVTEKIELTSGDNKIEISCMNEKGAESFRALTYATYNEPVKGDLYYLAFGVSKYQDEKLNLKYADKDATDLGQVFDKMKGKSFNNVYIKTYTNEQVTVDNIKQAKDFLKNSKVDDTFVLFIAGHGMHDKDKEATYYFLTYNAQVDNLSVSAANFELIEDLLQGIPPRNKLFLMDTCESGELEEGTETNYFVQADTRGLKARAARGMVMKGKSTKETQKSRAYLFEKDRYIYNDLLRRSGAIVFSSSKGGEFSYERDELQNGLFTEEIMNALTTNKADKNIDGMISTDELRDYVSKAVSDLSGDLQHPTVDRDNIYQKFGFGIK